MRTILDLNEAQELSPDLLAQAFAEARKRGLITENEVREYRHNLPPSLFQRPGIDCEVRMKDAPRQPMGLLS